ncbi:MAG TPA: hypothetical protein VFA07_14050, partial [Chthonomonadaceae bacterium]|nr:hypothetical protein [Chthonomonadaceae bacterium]
PGLLLAILTQAKRRRNWRYLFLTFWLPATVWVLMDFARTYRSGSLSFSFMLLWLFVLPCLIVLLGAFMDASTLLARIIQNTVRALIRLQDRQAIGPLVEAMDIEDGPLRRLVAEALTGLLPHLHASDAGLLTHSQRSRLYRVLQKCSEPSRFIPRWLRAQQSTTRAELANAILKAMEQVGDEKALPYVERLAACPAYSPAMERVRNAARDCLPFLQTRIAQVDASQTLLRPSAVEETPNHLLYPVLQSDPLPDLLVRPVQELPASG